LAAKAIITLAIKLRLSETIQNFRITPPVIFISSETFRPGNRLEMPDSGALHHQGSRRININISRTGKQSRGVI
jgi:hypothetical protein